MNMFEPSNSQIIITIVNALTEVMNQRTDFRSSFRIKRKINSTPHHKVLGIQISNGRKRWSNFNIHLNWDFKWHCGKRIAKWVHGPGLINMDCSLMKYYRRMQNGREICVPSRMQRCAPAIKRGWLTWNIIKMCWGCTLQRRRHVSGRNWLWCSR